MTGGIGDVIRNSVLRSFNFQGTDWSDLILGLVFSLLISIFILFIYKASFRGVVYNHSFGISLIVLSAISTIIISTISSNLVLSLGLVGALSLIRFRTAVKDPIDMVYLFWAITTGIACGAQRIHFAFIGALFIGIIMIVLNMTNMASHTYLLVVRYEKGADIDLRRRLSKFNYVIKAKTSTKNRIELTIQLKLRDNNTSFVDDISSVPGVQDAVLVSYNGDYAE